LRQPRQNVSQTIPSLQQPEYQTIHSQNTTLNVYDSNKSSALPSHNIAFVENTGNISKNENSGYWQTDGFQFFF